MWFLVFLILANPFASAPEEPISPWGAALRSAVLPGWGQMATGGKFKGVLSFALTTGLLSASWVVWSEYKEIYNERYVPAALSNSPLADRYYDQANQRYKLSRGLLVAAIGVWVYSMLDSYVDALLQNAEFKAKSLKFDISRLDRIDLEFKLSEGESRLSLKKEF
ncbi:hypothetical protein DRP77_09125 [Candidatus Poribacteria bacterium]|nr:MAG: hypothetical protein DRP77_09125 [Candidatus Poribacteria bacterium]